MGTRVLSLWLPYLATDRIRQERCRSVPGYQQRPLATFIDDQDEQPLVTLCARAEQAGLKPGMSRTDAQRRVPGLVTQSADPKSDARYLRALISWCERFTPFIAADRSVADDPGAALWLDIGSSAHLFGGEASVLAHLLGECRKRGLQAKAAIADHPGSAWAACRFGGDERRIMPTSGEHVALAPLPIKALRLEKSVCDQLESAGFERIEHLYALPRRSLSGRFGEQVAIRLDQALGLVDEPIAVDTPLPAQRAQMIFAEPIVSPKELSPIVEHLVRQLCVGLEAAGLGARRLTLALYRVDNSTVTCSIGANQPSRDRAHLSALIGNRFDQIDLGYGLERALLDAVEIEPMLSETIHWRGLGTVVDEPLPDLALEAKPDAIGRHEGLSDWAACPGPLGDPKLEPALPPFLVAERCRPQASPVAGPAAAAALALSPSFDQQAALYETEPRPLRLLRRPEPIEAIASLPGEPPVLFRWRQRLHKVVSAKGPETIAPDWWRMPEADDAALSDKATRRSHETVSARDYFAVEDSEGARFWLFREGGFEDGQTPLPRWFLHGIFG